jgi:hypothetical protein
VVNEGAQAPGAVQQVAAKQVITVHPDGAVSGLLHKKGQGMDIRTLGGKASVERASEVLWSETEQAWYVEFRKGAGAAWAGRVLDEHAVLAAGRSEQDPPFPFARRAWKAFARDWTAGDYGVYLFAEYEDGVKAEIAILDALRLRGAL